MIRVLKLIQCFAGEEIQNRPPADIAKKRGASSTGLCAAKTPQNFVRA